MVCGFSTRGPYGLCETFGSSSAERGPFTAWGGLQRLPIYVKQPFKIFGSPKPRTCPYSYFSNDQMYPGINRIRIRLFTGGVQMGRSPPLLQVPASWVLAHFSCWQEIFTHETNPFLLLIGFHKKKIITWERNLTSTAALAASLPCNMICISLLVAFNDKCSLPYVKEVKWKTRWHYHNLLIVNSVPSISIGNIPYWATCCIY